MNKNGDQKTKVGATNQEPYKYWHYFISFVTRFISWRKIVSWVTQNDKFLAAISTMSIAAFTFMLFVSTLLQWHIMGSSMRLDQRAWIGITNIIANGNIERLDSIEIHLTNTGKTPAKNVIVGIISKPLPWNTEPDFNEVKLSPKGSKMVVAPTQPIVSTYYFAEYSAQFTAEEALGIDNGKLFVICYGIITYDDIFDAHHWLTFCGHIRASDKEIQYYYKYNDTGDGYPLHFGPFFRGD
jgi:hypothetical protein